SDYRHIRVTGVNAINIDDGDELIDAQVTGDGDEVMLATHAGMAIRFPEEDVRQTGRVSRGVRGIRLADAQDHVVGMVVVRRSQDTETGPTLLVVTERGMGKRSKISDYRLQGRGGKGVINIRISDKTGKVVSIKSVASEDELVMITRKGVVNRQGVDGIRVIGRNTQGVRLIALDGGDEVMDVARLIPEEDEESELESPEAQPAGVEADGAGAGVTADGTTETDQPTAGGAEGADGADGAENDE
ncbi:MAG TPA: DNA gyrase C-terminal beta-propeller domain-containing protein, partial [Longimicrobiales bacterium]|nr:DNA gyrase C-terminal beta-propeller domain-containing protein [Longimicrobiales bacterium]